MGDPPGGAAQRPQAGRWTYDVFLSHHHADVDAVERIAARLRHVGVASWFSGWCLTPGGPWQDELAEGLAASGSCAVLIGPSWLGNWEREELAVALARAASEPDFWTFPVLLPGLPDSFAPEMLPPFLATRTWVDLRPGVDDERAFRTLIAAIGRTAPGPPDALPLGQPPYRGLRSFDERHAELFFGRDADIQRLLEKLKVARFLAVIGASGVGKSSLVRAGLVSRLRAGALPGSEAWRTCVLFPGARPTTTLAATLLQLSPEHSLHDLEDRLVADPSTLAATVEHALANGPADQRLVLVVDQAEEVFTLCDDSADRRAFLANLHYAAAVPSGPSMVVLALRADFYPRFSQYPPLAQLISAHQALVGPMSPDGLRQAIEEPARRADVSFESGLVETILRDVAREPGGLPLMEEALLELWRRRRRRELTHAGYVAVGRVEGALGQRAEAIFTDLGARQQKLAQRLLLRLTQPGEGTEDTRRRAPRSELSGRDRAADEVIQTLVESRLLVTSADPATGEPWVEVSHEALIRGWPRLREWIEADRTGLRTHRRLTEATHEWERLGRDEGALYRGSRLAEAVEWMCAHVGSANREERAFVHASLRTEARERRRGRRRKLLTAAIALLAMSAAWAVLRVFETADRASSRAVAAAAEDQLAVDPQRGLLLAIEAARRARTAEAEQALRDALARPAQRLAIPVGRDALSAAFSPDGQAVLTTRDRRPPQLWDARSGRLLAAPPGTDSAGGAGFSPSGRLLASTGYGAMIWIWTRGGRFQATMRDESAPAGDTTQQIVATVSDAPFSPDERLLVTGGSRGVTVWDASTGRRHRLLRSQESGSTRPRFSPDGRYVAASTHERVLRGQPDALTEIWHVDGGRHLVVRGDAFRFSADGKRLLTFANGVRLWALPSGRPIGTLSDTSARFATFSRDGRYVVTGSMWGVATYASRDGRRRARPPDGLRLDGHPAFSKDGRFVLDGGHLVALASAHSMPAYLEAGQDQAGSSTAPSIDLSSPQAFAPDGGSVLTRVGAQLRISALPRWHAVPLERLDVGAELLADVSPALALGVDGRGWTAAFADGAFGIRVWRGAFGATTRKRPSRTASDLDDVAGIALGDDGRRAVTVNDHGRATAWRTAPLRSTARSETGLSLEDQYDALPLQQRDPLATSADGRRLAITVEGVTSILGVSSGRVLATRRSGSDGAGGSAIAMSSDGRLVATSAPAQVWESRTGRAVARIGAGSTITAVAFSADTRRVAAAAGGRVRAWAVGSGELLTSARAGDVTSIAFSPDGSFLATASTDRGVRIWDSESGRQVAVLLDSAPGDAIVSFTRSGRSLVLAGDGSLETIACETCLPFDGLLSLARQRVRRSLTTGERDTFLRD